MLAKQPNAKQSQVNGAEVLIQSLIDHNVELLFGYPGGAVLPVYDTLYTSSFRNILTRHEQGAAHAAEGYAKATGKTGVICVTSGPGASNAITGIADAMMDSTPLVVLTGQVGTNAIGTQAFQELDIISMTKAVTKANFQVRQVSQLAQIMDQAFTIAQTGRKGPVVVDLPKDIMAAAIDVPTKRTTPSTDRNETDLSAFQKASLKAILSGLRSATKPLLLLGAGVSAAQAGTLAKTFVHQWQTPAVATLLGLGILTNEEPLFLGMGGMHGTYAANMTFQECDFLLNIGARFDDRLVPNVAKFAPNAKIAHIDIDPNEIDRIVKTDYAAVADAKAALEFMVQQPVANYPSQPWLRLVQQRKRQHPYHYRLSDSFFKPQEVVEAVGKVTRGQAMVVTDVGQHQMWTAQFYPFHYPQQLITSGGLGTMGFGIPAAIGAKYAHPDRDVVLFVGDGGFQMTSEELEVLATEQLDIKIVLLNNKTLGMVRQWQDEFYQHHRSQTMFTHQPNFEKLAAAYDVAYYELTKPMALEPTLKAIFAEKGPALINVTIPSFEQVYPMIAPGCANDDMMGLDQ
ncbi:biosynthetic-type acetolactate synthase large subunit [Agrilactobacillus yilanensis]|uniref:Acetolactate synthase n=1 Tax=Agrilactobacillus yilanensis TaxID=2485997 RepID=A0ABW4JCP4_9LACO|nr:biosynthetic-type acetolactate synthase large subunit [Agrilactobacillus yilanensis]